MRNFEKIQQDPQATPEEIYHLQKVNPKFAILHPNCPPELWWMLARDWPIEALDSPAYAILTLESPERWNDLETRFLSDWIVFGIHRLSDRDKVYLMADCIDRHLHVFAAAYPGNPILVNMLANTRLWADGKYATDKIDEEHNKVCQLLATLSGGTLRRIVECVARVSGSYLGRIDYEAELVLRFLTYFDEESALVERRWQWARLLQYLRGDV